MGKRSELAGFRLGDLVMLCVPKDSDGGVYFGETGVVVDFDGSSRIGVRWDKFSGAKHNCSGKCENGHGWYVCPSDLEHRFPESEAFDIEDSSLMGLLGC